MGFKAGGFFGAGYGGAEGSAAGTNLNDETDSSGSNNLKQDAFASKHTEVRQEWLGGNSGLTVGDWRDSMNMNSNWRIIDREIDSCIGIWNLLDLVNVPDN